MRKRLYTRLMDLYRHNDIRIPGFNTLARTMLRTKAEAHVRSVARMAKGREEEIARWAGTKRFFFGYGVFRSGTTFLADLLNRQVKNAIVQHEANVNDYWFYAEAMHSQSEALRYVRDYRMNEVYFRMNGHDFDVYGEINPFLRRHCAAMQEVFPTAKQFHVVRDPRNVLRSLMSRELFGPKDPMGTVITPPVDDPVSGQWPEMSRFAKLCWLWAADNRFIREHVEHVVRFEDVRTDFDRFDQGILTYLDLEMEADVWQREVGQVFNSTPRYTFPAYADWSSEQKHVFEQFCGEEMVEYGY